MRQIIAMPQALVEAAREEMQRDPEVFIMGEDVGLYGGAYGATRGLFKEFGEWRVIDTPISEATIGGAAVGAAMAGMRPIAEIMYVDFTPLAMDQIANQGAKNRYMFGGKTSVPDGHPHRGRRGPRHRGAPLAEPRIAVDALPRHLRGHAVHALRRQGPAQGRHPRRQPGHVHRAQDALQAKRARCPRKTTSSRSAWPISSAPGKDVTMVTYSRMVLRALEAAETLAKEGIDVEVIDLRTLKPLDIDTHRRLGQEDGPAGRRDRGVREHELYQRGHGAGERAAFDYLDAPMVRVAAANVPVPRAEVLEDMAIPNVNRIMAACRKVVADGRPVEVFIPKYGQTVEEVTIVQWFVEDGAKVEEGPGDPGDRDRQDDVLRRSLKARAWLHLGPYKAGDIVPVLTVVAVIGKPDDKFVAHEVGERSSRKRSRLSAGRAGRRASAAVTVTAAGERGVRLPAGAQAGGGEGGRPQQGDADRRRGRAGRRARRAGVSCGRRRRPRPLAQKLAAEAGVDLRQVAGTGPGGKITKKT